MGVWSDIMRMQNRAISCLCVIFISIFLSSAGAQTFYWNPSSPLLNGGGEAQRACNWTATAAGGGAYPKSTLDDDFSGTSLSTVWNIVDFDGFADTPINPYVVVSANQLTLRAYGADVWQNVNQYVGVSRTDITGDFDVSVEVVSQTQTSAGADPWAKAGIMMRNSVSGTDTGGFAIVAVTPLNGVAFQYDSNGTVGELKTWTSAAGVVPCWLRLAKRGTTVSAYYKTALGNPWTQIGTPQTPQNTAANSNIVLFASAHSTTTATTVVFDDFTGGGNIATTGLDLNFGGGSGANSDSAARLTGPLSAKSVTFAGSKMAFDFLTSTLSITDTANFAAAKSITAGTGLLAFIENASQKLTPRASTVFPSISKSGSGLLTLAGSSMTAGKLTLTDGVLSCGGMNQEFAGLSATGGSISGLDAADTLTFSGDVKFSGLTALPATGAIQVRATSKALNFTPGTAPFNHLILWPRPLTGNAAIKVGAGTLDVRGNMILLNEKIGAGTGFNGDVDFGIGNPNVTLTGNVLRADNGAAAGVASLRLFMGKGTWTTKGDFNLALPAGLSADSSTLEFTADAPVVQNVSVGTDTLGAVRHTGTGTLNLASAFLAGSFAQTSGVLNLNGSNLTLTGSLTISNGTAASILGLGGRTLKTGGDISLSGTSAAQLNMNPATAWKATAAGSLIAAYADIGNSDASGSKAAGSASATCVDFGSNLNWSFPVAPPSFLVQPLSKTVVVGQSVGFKVVVSGTGPIAYAWRRQGDTTVLSRTDSLSIVTVSESQNGAHYYCTATNSVSSVPSLDAVLTVFVPPVIDVQPANDSVLVGQSASFTVTAHGTAPLRYAWRRTGAPALVLGTGPTFTIDTTLVAQDGYSYACTVTDTLGSLVGSVVSNPAILSLKFPPRIVLQPINTTGTAGLKATFTIRAAGTAPLAFAWTRLGDTTLLSSDSNFTVGPLGLTDSASYRCKVSNSVGSVTSNTVKLTVVEVATIVREPVDLSKLLRSKAVFTAGVEGAKPLVCAWRRKGDTTVISRDTLLTIDSVKLKDNGAIFIFTVSNDYGADTSREAVLTVVSCDSVFKVTPETLTVDEGQPIAMKGTAACSSARLWSVVSGPAPSILDPEVDSLNLSAPRLISDTVIIFRFSAQYGAVWQTKDVTVKVRASIPDPKFSLPAPGKWDGLKTYVIRPTLTNLAALKASSYSLPLHYQWFLSAPIADTTQAGDSLSLSKPTQYGNLDVTLCMDNGGVSTCAVHTVQINLPSVSLAQRAARFGPVYLNGRVLAWNVDAEVLVWDFHGRVLWRGHEAAGSIVTLPESAAIDLLSGRARMEIYR